ncbi:MAG: hypothetical protein ACHQZS_00195 [Candidatus Binatales bacterium]
MRCILYRILRQEPKPELSESRAGAPVLLRDWPKHVEQESRRRRNIAILNRMTAREARERRAVLGFWRYRPGRLPCRKGGRARIGQISR